MRKSENDVIALDDKLGSHEAEGERARNVKSGDVGSKNLPRKPENQ